MAGQESPRNILLSIYSPLIGGLMLACVWGAVFGFRSASETRRQPANMPILQSAYSGNPFPDGQKAIIALPLKTVVDIAGFSIRLTVEKFTDDRCKTPYCTGGDVTAGGMAEDKLSGGRTSFHFGMHAASRATIFGHIFELVGVSVPRQTIYIRER